MALRTYFIPLTWALCGLMGCSSDDVNLGGPGGNGDNGGPKPETYPRLVVAGMDGVRIWDKVTSLTSSVPASAHLDAPGSGAGLGLDGDTLLVATSGTDAAGSQFHRFDNASELADGAKPTSTLSSAAFTGQTATIFRRADMQVDSRHNAWVLANAGDVYRVPANAAAPDAHFANFIFYMAYDEPNDRLLTSNIETYHFPVWSNASSKTGYQGSSDYEFSDVTPRRIIVAGGRVYTNRTARQSGTSDIAIWNDIASIQASKAPDVIMTDVCSTGPNDSTFVNNVSVVNDVLLAVVSAPLAGTDSYSEKVCIFKGASAITGSRAPDAVASSPDGNINTGNDTDKAWLSKDDHLFLLDAAGIAIFKNATTAPTFVNRIAYDNAGAVDFLVLE